MRHFSRTAICPFDQERCRTIPNLDGRPLRLGFHSIFKHNQTIPPVCRCHSHVSGLVRMLSPVDRRECLQFGGVFGLSLPTLLASRKSALARPEPRAKACIMLFLLGGPPQQETWDPKPDSPVEARGDLRSIQSETRGLLVGETMPLTAKLTNKIAVLRAVSTNDSAHSSSGYYMTTGHPHAPLGVENAKPGAPNDWPSLGGVIRRVHSDRQIPTAITLPEQSANDGNLTWPGQDAGFLGRSYDPWLLECDPNAASFRLPGLGLPADVPTSRFDRRRMLLNQVDHRLDEADRNGGVGTHSRRIGQACELISSPAARRAFDLEKEALHVRDRYGRNGFGQRCLLARRLVEAGVPFITVYDGGWDHHRDIFGALRKRLPDWDNSVATLIQDLKERGLLESTLVVALGEFGRTPAISTLSGENSPGRDHWANAMSVLMAGGGTPGGTVVGATDRKGHSALDNVQSPENFVSTIYHKLGIDPDKVLYTPQGRPTHLVSDPTPIRELI